MKHRYVWIIAGIWLVATGFAPGAAQLYSKAVKFAKAGKNDFAYMQFNKLLRNYPASKYREPALFATGEYYFLSAEWQRAQTAFQTYLDEFPDSRERLYALAYLLSIADKENNQSSADEFAKKIINLQQVSFVFRKTKEITYRSALGQDYKAVIHIDKIEFFVEGELFAQVAF